MRDKCKEVGGEGDGLLGEAVGVQKEEKAAHIWRSAQLQPSLVGGTPWTSIDLLLQASVLTKQSFFVLKGLFFVITRH